jgi:RNA polymerase sigma-70 factor (ECF subfamily)
MNSKKQSEIFSRWLEEHKGVLFKIIRVYASTEEDQEDLFQEISVQLWRSIPSFKGESKISTWIYRVSLNHALKWTNKEKRRTDKLEAAQEQLHVLQQQEQADPQLDWLYDQIARLDKVDRSLCLLLFDGYQYQEIAELIGISENYVGVKLNRIKKYLTEQAKKNFNNGL